jgi:hypothetical protein
MGTKRNQSAALPLRKGGRRLNSSTEKIWQVGAALGKFSPKQLRETGFTDDQVNTALKTLQHQGKLRKIGRGQYELTNERQKVREAPLEERIWHAMRINPSWSCSEIALQAGTTVSYVYKRLRAYRAEGFVKRAGARQVSGGMERLWRLSGKGRENLARPEVEIFEPDPAVMLAINLAKLVATGLAKNCEDARAKALGYCNELAGLLEAGRQ